MKKEAIIFDLDGTLLDTIDDLADAGNAALRQCGFPEHPRESYFYFIGDGIISLVERVTPEDRRDAETLATVEMHYRREYGQRWNDKTKPYDGVLDMLRALVQRKIRMGVLSNKPEEFTIKCVDAQLAEWPLDPIRGFKTETPRKPDPTNAIEIADYWNLGPEQIIFVGDTRIDMETAVAAGMTAVGVSWGFRPEEELRQFGADVVIHSPMELLDIIE